MIKYSLTCLLAGLFLTSCQSENDAYYTPKPKGYARIDLPSPAYTLLPAGHPYSFEISKYAVVLPDTFARSEKDWIFVAYPQYGASIQLTYRNVTDNPKKLEAAIGDAYKLAAKHQIKASGINEAILKTQTGKKAVIFELNGDMPSYFQFFTTDTTKHFLRGAVYFNIAEKQDSLQPVIDYLKADAVHLLNTLKWQN